MAEAFGVAGHVLVTAQVCGPQRECIIANREPDSAIKLELRDDYSSASCARGPRLHGDRTGTPAARSAKTP